MFLLRITKQVNYEVKASNSIKVSNKLWLKKFVGKGLPEGHACFDIKSHLD